MAFTLALSRPDGGDVPVPAEATAETVAAAVADFQRAAIEALETRRDAAQAELQQMREIERLDTFAQCADPRWEKKARQSARLRSTRS